MSLDSLKTSIKKEHCLTSLCAFFIVSGENLVDAAIREVHEETNISTEFESVLTIRHGHNGMYGCSDIYTVVSLRPLNDNIEKCEREIDQCKWMDINEYLTHPDIHELNKFQLQKFLEYKKCNIKVNCYHGIHQILLKPYTVYSVTNSNEKSVQTSEHCAIRADTKEKGDNGSS